MNDPKYRVYKDHQEQATDGQEQPPKTSVVMVKDKAAFEQHFRESSCTVLQLTVSLSEFLRRDPILAKRMFPSPSTIMSCLVTEDQDRLNAVTEDPDKLYDRERLNPGIMLNDNIVNFALMNYSVRTNFFCLSSEWPNYFSTKSAKQLLRHRICLVNKGVVIIPIHIRAGSNGHWVLGVLDATHSAATLYTYDSLDTDMGKVIESFQNLFPELEHKRCKVPRQKNYVDCGVHMLYAAHVIMDKGKILQKIEVCDINAFRQSIQTDLDIWILSYNVNWNALESRLRKVRHIIEDSTRQGVKHDGYGYFGPGGARKM